MTTRTLIPEALVGAGFLGTAMWLINAGMLTLFTTGSSEWFRLTVDTTSLPYISLQLTSVLCILMTMLFLLLGGYFCGVVAESFIFALLKKMGIYPNVELPK